MAFELGDSALQCRDRLAGVAPVSAQMRKVAPCIESLRYSLSIACHRSVGVWHRARDISKSCLTTLIADRSNKFCRRSPEMPIILR